MKVEQEKQTCSFFIYFLRGGGKVLWWLFHLHATFFRGSLSDICIAPRSIWGQLFLSDPWFFFPSSSDYSCNQFAILLCLISSDFHLLEVDMFVCFSHSQILSPIQRTPNDSWSRGRVMTHSWDASLLRVTSMLSEKAGTSSATIKSLNQATLASHRYGMVEPHVWSSEVLFVVVTTGQQPSSEGQRSLSLVSHWLWLRDRTWQKGVGRGSVSSLSHLFFIMEFISELHTTAV